MLHCCWKHLNFFTYHYLYQIKKCIRWDRWIFLVKYKAKQSILVVHAWSTTKHNRPSKINILSSVIVFILIFILFIKFRNAIDYLLFPGLSKSLIEKWRIWSIVMTQTPTRCWTRKNNQWCNFSSKFLVGAKYCKSYISA